MHNLLMVTLVLGAIACTHRQERRATDRVHEVKANEAGASGVRQPAIHARATSHAKIDADNTKVNKVDSAGNTLTPSDQSGAPSDVKIAARIRQDLVHNGALSVDAKNVKIIVIDGVVTLRGPVKSEGERMQVLSAARRVVGDNKVQSEINVIGH